MPTTKERVLSELMAQQGAWVSGEQFSSQLGISRSAIWKHINALKNDGHEIQSAPKKGYRLQRTADRMLPEAIAATLTTQRIGRNILTCLEQTDSTNVEAKALAAQGAPEGTVVVAESQNQGRGRRGRTWFSPAGRNIYTSIVLRPILSPAQAPQITLMTGVAVAKTLVRFASLEAKIKWPNDILIHGKKIAGILTEVSTDMDMVDHVVVGIGINVNISAQEMPKDIQQTATSVRMATGMHHCRVALLCALLDQFERSYNRLKSSGFPAIMAQWRRMSDIIGQPVYVDVMDKRYQGVVATVDDDGVLILKDASGGTHRIFSGDVTRLRKE